MSDRRSFLRQVSIIAAGVAAVAAGLIPRRSSALAVTHRRGEACPADMFIVSPPEALLFARYDRDVEVRDTDGHFPYTVRCSATDGTGRAAVHLGLAAEYKGKDVHANARGSSFVNIDPIASGIGLLYSDDGDIFLSASE